MKSQPRRMSEIMQEMSERLLRHPDAAHSSEAAHVALMFANIAWNECVGMGGERECYRSAWEPIEAENPEMWSEFKSNDVNAMIDELVAFKEKRYLKDQRRILRCGIVNSKIRVEWLAPAAPGVDSKLEMTLYGLVLAGKGKKASKLLQKTHGMSRLNADAEVISIAMKLGLV